MGRGDLPIPTPRESFYTRTLTKYSEDGFFMLTKGGTDMIWQRAGVTGIGS